MGLGRVGEQIATALLAASAVALATTAVLRELRAADSPQRTRTIRTYRDYAVGLKTFGAADARTTIVVFSDFECPFCRRIAAALDTVVSRDSERVRVVFRHLPNSATHPSARMAALSAECAAKAGNFRAFHDQLFRGQDTLSKIDWTALAAIVGVRDTARFRLCLGDPTTSHAVTVDSTAAMQLNVTGTPAYLVDDLLQSGAVSADSLMRLVRRRLSP